MQYGGNSNNHHQLQMLRPDGTTTSTNDNTFSPFPDQEKKAILVAWWKERKQWEKERAEWEQEQQARTLRYRHLKASTYKHEAERAAMAKEMQDQLRATLDTCVSDGSMSVEYASLKLKYNQNFASWTMERQNFQRVINERMREAKILRGTVVHLQKVVNERALEEEAEKDARFGEAVELLQVDNEKLQLQVDVLTKKEGAYKNKAIMLQRELLALRQSFTMY